MANAPKRIKSANKMAEVSGSRGNIGLLAGALVGVGVCTIAGGGVGWGLSSLVGLGVRAGVWVGVKVLVDGAV